MGPFAVETWGLDEVTPGLHQLLNVLAISGVDKLWYPDYIRPEDR